MSFHSQHIIITGGSSGIGKATAKLFASSGANLTIIARNIDLLTTAKAEIESVQLHSNQQVLILTADVSQRQQAENAIQIAIDKMGFPDVLITSAGMAYPGYFQEIPIEIFEQTMAVNYFGSLYCIRAIIPVMQQQHRGQIVLLSSGAGLIGIYGYSAYSPSKFALRGLAESLRGELKPFGITISIVYPPDTDTPQLEAENRTKPPETRKITETAETWTAEAVALGIIKGVKQKKFVITPGMEMSLIQRLHSILSPLLNWYMDNIISQNK
ncbi:MAG: SDR family oxidoreductase [Microcoleaceae cyanobacterium]